MSKGTAYETKREKLFTASIISYDVPPFTQQSCSVSTPGICDIPEDKQRHSPRAKID